jgi:hypothetical protein
MAGRRESSWVWKQMVVFVVRAGGQPGTAACEFPTEMVPYVAIF